MNYYEERKREIMKKYLGKFLVLGMMCMLFSVTAFAAKKEFSFSVIPKGGNGYTATNAKSDNEGYAYVTVESANLISGDLVRYVVTNTERTKEVTSAVTFSGTNKPYKQTLKYYSGYAKKGKSYRLKIRTYNYSLQISGRWNS